MDLKMYVDRMKFSVFVMFSELLERAEKRRDGTEKDFLRFSRDGHENEGQLFRLHGSTDMRVESRVQVEDGSG